MAISDTKDEQKSFAVTTSRTSTYDEDDKELEALGYVTSFKRELSNLATVCPVTRAV